MTGRTVRLHAGLDRVHVLLDGYRVNHMIGVGLPLAGQRITVRLDGPVARIVSGGILARTVACPLPPEARPGCAVPGPERRSRRACPARSP